MSDLLAQIQAQPDDDALRSVYADELLRAGDPRGELINVELRLASATVVDEHERSDLMRRRRELREAHASTWWELSPWQVYTRRGFPVRITLNRFVHLPAWIEREPVEELQLLLLRTTNLEAVFASPLLRRLAKLILVNAPPTWLDALRESPLADRLESLELWNCERPPNRDVFDAFPVLRRVRCCGLVKSHEWMVAWEGAARLEELELPSIPVDSSTLDPLFARAQRLRRLDISGHPYWSEMAGYHLDVQLGKLAALDTLVNVGCNCVREDELDDAHRRRVEFRAPSGEHWLFEQIETARWQVRVDGVVQPIIEYRNNLPQPPAVLANIGLTIGRLAMGGGSCGLAVANDALSLTLHAATSFLRMDTNNEYCTIAASVGGPLRIFDAQANRAGS